MLLMMPKDSTSKKGGDTLITLAICIQELLIILIESKGAYWKQKVD